MVGDAESDPIGEFEMKEKELLKEHKEKLKCQSEEGKCTGSFISKGRGGNSTVNGVKRLQIKCNGCEKGVGLHLALSRSEDPRLINDAKVLQALYERAAGKRSTATKAEKEEMPTQANHAAMDVDEKNDEFTSESDYEDAVETNKDSVKVGRPTSKRMFIQTPQASRQPGRKVYAMAVSTSALKRGRGCGKECEIRMEEMSAVMRAQAEELAALRETVGNQNAVILELATLMRSQHEGARPTNSPPAQTTAPTVENKKKVSAPKVAADKVRTESEAQTKTQQQPTIKEPTPLSNEKDKVGSFAEVTKRFIPVKEYRELKRCAVPFKAPVRVVKLHFRFSWKRDMERAKAFQLARNMLAAANIKDVLEVSFIGKSILEIFVEEGKADGVRSAMKRWCEGVDTFLTQSEIDNFPQGRLAVEDILTKKVSRATFLCARNRSLVMQDCILRGIDPTLHAKILKEAEEIRKQWASSDDDTAEVDKDAPREEPKGGNQC